MLFVQLTLIPSPQERGRPPALAHTSCQKAPDLPTSLSPPPSSTASSSPKNRRGDLTGSCSTIQLNGVPGRLRVSVRAETTAPPDTPSSNRRGGGGIDPTRRTEATRSDKTTQATLQRARLTTMITRMRHCGRARGRREVALNKEWLSQCD